MIRPSNIPDDRLHRLFRVVKEEVIYGSGGDGVGIIISDHFRELADRFEVYENEAEKPEGVGWFLERSGDLDSIVFMNYQEGIIFTDRIDLNDAADADIIVEIEYTGRYATKTSEFLKNDGQAGS